MTELDAALRKAYGPESQEAWKKVRKEYDSPESVAIRNLLRGAIRTCDQSKVPPDVRLWSRKDEPCVP